MTLGDYMPTKEVTPYKPPLHLTDIPSQPLPDLDTARFKPLPLPDLIAQFKQRLPEDNPDPKLNYTQGSQLGEILVRGSYYMCEGYTWQRQTSEPSRLEVFTKGDPFGNGTNHTYSTIEDPRWFMQYVAACGRKLNSQYDYVVPILMGGVMGGIVGSVAAVAKGLYTAEGFPLFLKAMGLGVLGAAVGIHYYSAEIANRHQHVDNTALDKSRATRWTGRSAIERVLESVW